MKGNRVNSSKTVTQSGSRSFYQKFSAAAWGMVMWNPVPAEDVSKLHQQALISHEEAQKISDSAQEALKKSEEILCPSKGYT